MIAKEDSDLVAEKEKTTASSEANHARIRELEAKLAGLRRDRVEEDKEQGVQIQGEDGDIEVEY